MKTTGAGALNVDTMCQEGAFVIDNSSFYPDTQLGLELTANADWQRRGLYIGPRVRPLHAVDVVPLTRRCFVAC